MELTKTDEECPLCGRKLWWDAEVNEYYCKSDDEHFSTEEVKISDWTKEYD